MTTTYIDTPTVLATLKLTAGDPAEPAIEVAVMAANELLDEHLDPDKLTDPIQSKVGTAALIVALDLYRRPAAPFGITDAFVGDLGPVPIARDPLRGVWPLIGNLTRTARVFGV